MRGLTLTIFLLALGCFVKLGAGGLYLRDSGELTTAAALLGIAHETGFPLYCLLARLFMMLPLGEVAFRAVLFSAASGAAAAVLVAVLVRRLFPAPGRGGVWGGAVAAVFLCGQATFFKAATVAEVYAPTAAGMAAGLLCLEAALSIKEGAGARVRAGLGLALVGGLGLGLHASLRLLLGPVAVAVFAAALCRRERWPLLAPGLLLLGALPLAYLPLRAARSPLSHFGAPETWAGFVAHVSAARIRSSFADQIMTRDLGALAARLRGFLGLVLGQIGGPAAALALGGLVSLRWRRRALALALGAVLLGDVLYAGWINPMGVADWQDGVPTALVLAIGAGCAVAGLWRRPWLAVAAAVVALVPLVLAEAPAKLGLRDPVATAWTRAALSSLPSRGLLLAVSDDLAAGALYEQGVAGDRPDVSVLVRQFIWDGAYTARMLARGDAGWLDSAELAAVVRLPEDDRVRQSPRLLAHIVGRAPERVGWEPDRGDAPPPDLALVPGIPVFTLRAAGPVPLPDPAALVARLSLLMDVSGAGVPSDPLVRQLAARTLRRLRIALKPP